MSLPNEGGHFDNDLGVESDAHVIVEGDTSSLRAIIASL